MTVAVSISHLNCHAYVRRAVESVLAQTHEDLICVVVSDADTRPPWQELGDITDPRLRTYTSVVNRGPEFWHEAVRRASGCEFLAVQDADDTSDRMRLSRLLRAIGDAPGVSSHIGGDYNGTAHKPAHRKLNERFRHRRCHAGLWRSADLETIGGYYGGHRLGWDSLIVNAMSLLGEAQKRPMPHVDRTLYYVNARPDSITRTAATRKGSPARVAAAEVAAGKWSRMWEARKRTDLQAVIHHEMTCDVTPADADALELESSCIRSIL